MEKYDMNYYKNHFTEKMDKLLAYKYKYLKSKSKRHTQFGIDYNDKHPSNKLDANRQSLVRGWMNTNKNNAPKIEHLINICNMYDVDLDYFFTEQEAYNISVSTAAKTIGLSDKSVDIIRNHHKIIRDLLDRLLESAEFTVFLLRLLQYSNAILPKLKYSDINQKETTLMDMEVFTYLKNAPKQSVEDILDYLRESYKKNRINAGKKYLKELNNKVKEIMRQQKQ